MRRSDGEERRTSLKRLFEVSVHAPEGQHGRPDTLIALADDERDLRSLAELRSARVVRLVALPGLVTAVGPSRIVSLSGEAETAA